MDVLSNLLYGFSVALTPMNLVWVMIGVIAGTVVGILPGLGAPATIALLLPLTIGMDPAAGLIMLAGIYYGAKYGGSTTSILLNVPGESSSVVTCLDGYALAKKGRAGAALGMAAIASFVAGTVGVVGLTLVGPLIAEWAVRFGPPEYFALMTLALTLVAFLGGRSLVKGLAAAFLGLFLSLIGSDVMTGESRFTFGRPELLDGMDFIILSVGLFAVAEVLVNLERRVQGSLFVVPRRLKELLPTLQDLRDSRFAFFQSSIIGFVIGVLPGAGATIASFLSYGVEKRFSKHPERFGSGVIEGVAAPEGANNADAGGAMVPLLTLGIPGGASTAILLGALVLWGLEPGPLLFTEHREVVWPVIASMYIGNVALLVLNLPLVPLFANLLRLPYHVLFSGVLLISIVGVYALNQDIFDLWILALFSVLGYVLRKLDVPAAPLVLAFVLGPLAERAIRTSLVMSSGELSILFTRPLSAVLITAALLMILAPMLGGVARFRARVAEES